MFSKHSKNWELEVLFNLANIVPIKDRADLEHSTLIFQFYTILKINALSFNCAKFHILQMFTSNTKVENFQKDQLRTEKLLSLRTHRTNKLIFLVLFLF
jgi:hypothetical protein